ncbi:MAG: hypothetical protein ACRDBP_04120 [Luteolibacter sp.]
MNKNLQLTIAWFALACVLSGGGIWWAKTRVARKTSPIQQQQQSVSNHSTVFNAPSILTDPATDYAVRCQKGLTDPEIVRILDDFSNAGLDLPVGAEMQLFFDRRQIQHRWYRDALIDGLNLTSAQSEQVTLKLEELHQLGEKIYLDLMTGAVPFDKIRDYGQGMPGFRIFEDATSRRNWCPGNLDEYLPWNLCSLTTKQESITWKKWIDQSKQHSEESTNHENSLTSQIQTSASFPSADSSILKTRPHRSIPSDYQEADAIFPFSAEPTIWRKSILVSPEENLIADIRRFHSAQLKLLLLTRPFISQHLREALRNKSR